MRTQSLTKALGISLLCSGCFWQTGGFEPNDGVDPELQPVPSDREPPDDDPDDANDDDGEPVPTPREVVVDPDEVASCESGPRPARCDADLQTDDWGDAAVLSSLVLVGTDEDPECCVDIDGNGTLDNSLGTGLAGVDLLDSTNAPTNERLASGDAAVVLELVETGADSFDLQWWRAYWYSAPFSEAGPNALMLSGGTFDDGLQSRYWIPDVAADQVATFDWRRLGASRGIVELPLVLLGVPLWVDAHVVGLEADLLPDDDGVVLQGRLGVVIGTEEIYDSFRDFVEFECDCLSTNGEPLLDEEAACPSNLDTWTCRDEGRTACVNFAENCSLIPAAEIFADSDLDGEYPFDAISAGFEFEAQPGRIVGIMR